MVRSSLGEEHRVLIMLPPLLSELGPVAELELSPAVTVVVVVVVVVVRKPSSPSCVRTPVAVWPCTAPQAVFITLGTGAMMTELASALSHWTHN